MFDLLQTPSSATLKYVVGRLRDLAERIAAVGGGLIDGQALSTAITAVNAKRKLLQQASVLWQSATPSLTGVDALTVISCGSFMTQQDYLARLDALLASPPPSFATGPRILIKGSSQSDLRFTTLVEGLGGSVVAHDHLWGDRTYATAVEERTEPWGALARHYCLDIPSPREYPQAKADARFLDLVQRARVTGVIFYHDEWDDTLGWEYPDQKQLLDRHGVPSLFLKRQPYFEPPELQQAEAVRAFLDTLRRTP
jgi:benzoyl-CoA reductase/2-hydroxyglutaryl-CoA dehydratase subunit BcrC/BadD/HgdB